MWSGLFSLVSEKWQNEGGSGWGGGAVGDRLKCPPPMSWMCLGLCAHTNKTHASLSGAFLAQIKARKQRLETGRDSGSTSPRKKDSTHRGRVYVAVVVAGFLCRLQCSCLSPHQSLSVPHTHTHAQKMSPEKDAFRQSERFSTQSNPNRWASSTNLEPNPQRPRASSL